ncbi:MAG: STAS domain-containing protein [Verrucomicrobiota bacterium]
MEVSESTKDNTKVLTIKGDIDLNHSPQLRELLRGLIADKCPSLLIDFTNVQYIDSSGLATFVEYYQGSRKYSGKVVMAGMTQRVRSVFDLVRLGEIFSIHDSVDEALTQLKV